MQGTAHQKAMQLALGRERRTRKKECKGIVRRGGALARGCGGLWMYSSPPLSPGLAAIRCMLGKREDVSEKPGLQ